MLIIVQARMSSRRLPGKMLREIGDGVTLLQAVVSAVEPLRAEFGAGLVVATSRSSADDAIERACGEHGWECFRGDETNVLGRFVEAMRYRGADKCMRVCGDNPFLDTGLARDLIRETHAHGADYYGYLMPGGVPAICRPAGLFVECATREAMESVLDDTPTRDDLEHVTRGIYRRPRLCARWKSAPRWTCAGWLRLTCDLPDDLDRIRTIWRRQPHGAASRRELVEWLDGQADLKAAMLSGNKASPKTACAVA